VKNQPFSPKHRFPGMRGSWKHAVLCPSLAALSLFPQSSWNPEEQVEMPAADLQEMAFNLNCISTWSELASTLGFEFGDGQHLAGVKLRPGESGEYSVEVIAGQQYCAFATGRCGTTDVDIDLLVHDAAGEVIHRDTLPDAIPEAMWFAPESGTNRITIRNASLWQEARVAMVVMRHDSSPPPDEWNPEEQFETPIVDSLEMTFNLVRLLTWIEAASSLGLGIDDGQHLVGVNLGPGETWEYPLPVIAGQEFRAFASGRCGMTDVDIDLLVQDATGEVLYGDTLYDAIPEVLWFAPTSGTNRITIRKASLWQVARVGRVIMRRDSIPDPSTDIAEAAFGDIITAALDSLYQGERNPEEQLEAPVFDLREMTLNLDRISTWTELAWMIGFGLNDGPCIVGVNLLPGEACDYPVEVMAGQEYGAFATGRCGMTDIDIDLLVQDATGKVLDGDVLADAIPEIGWFTPESGTSLLTIRNTSSWQEARVALVIMRRGSSLHPGAEALRAAFADVTANALDLPNPGEWRLPVGPFLVGGVVSPGAKIGLGGQRSPSDYAAVTGGCGAAEDTDLYVSYYDASGSSVFLPPDHQLEVITSDSRAARNAEVHYSVDRGADSVSIEVCNYRSSGPAVLLGVVLSAADTPGVSDAELPE